MPQSGYPTHLHSLFPPLDYVGIIGYMRLD